MQPKSTIDNHREISAALDFLRQASADDGAFELDPRVVSGWVEMSLGALEVLVTAKRGKHSDDKALKQTVEEHLEHARDHANEALDSSISDSSSGGYGLSGLDDDNLPHFDHATARIALLYARKAIVERDSAGAQKTMHRIVDKLHADREKRAAEFDRVLFAKIKEHGDELQAKQRKELNRALDEHICAPIYEAITGEKLPRPYPNSCKVDKVERGVEVSVPWSFATYYQYPGKLNSVYLSTPTRPIETDNKPGKADESCNPFPRGFWTTWTGAMPYCADESVTTYSLRSNAGNGPWTSCIPNGCPITLCGTRTLWGIYTPPSGVAKEGGVAVGVFVNYEPLSTKKTAQCAAPKSTPVSAWSLYVDDVKVTDVTDVQCEYGSGIPGMDKMPGFVSETAFGVKPIGIAMNGARRGELVSIAIGGSGTVTLCDRCHGCSYAKWPNKGPGYSERCDKCKLDPNRPGYASK